MAIPNILITGFKPFHGYPYNPSEFLVGSIVQKWVPGGYYNLQTQVFNVAYNDVLAVANLYQAYNPVVAIHLGQFDGINGIRLECCGHNSGYTMPDVFGQLPPQGICDFTKPELLYTSFDPNRILADYSTRNTSTALTFSNDAGHFLCDFIYFKALASSQTRRVVFVHVPMFSPEFTIDKLTQAIMDLIPALVTQA